jgi:glycosyltransferase involved in cell wall biosynthesis
MRTICFCNSNIPWGGGERWHFHAALGLARRGWRALLLCHPQSALHARASAYPAIRTVPFVIGRASFLNPLKGRALRGLFRREGVEAVIMNLPSDLKLAGPAAKSAGVRHVIYRRGSALPIRDSLLNRYLLRHVITRCIVNSRATLRQILVNNPAMLPEERVSILPNSVNIPAFDAALAGVAGQPPLAPRRPGGLVIGNAGRLNRQKGQHLLLHLCAKTLERGVDVRLLLAGEGEREEELKALARSLGLADRVIFTGFLPDLSLFWRSIDVFALSSLWEGFGNVLIEAMLAERPVFAFSVSYIPELIFEGPEGNGRLFPLPLDERKNSPEPGPEPAPGGDPLDLMAEALAKLARHPEEAQRMGRHGRAFALRFSEDALLDRLEALLE